VLQIDWLVNRHRTVVVRHLTLRDILERRSDNLWTEEIGVASRLTLRDILEERSDNSWTEQFDVQ
jgi:hypothetical protein